jgi:sugar/nucleoside kinase (ribokinase family)
MGSGEWIVGQQSREDEWLDSSTSQHLDFLLPNHPIIPSPMVSYVIYGKIIIDDIAPLSGGEVRSMVGGGGPQAAYGARLWSDSVGLVTRTGTDLGTAQVGILRRLDVDLAGWRRFPAIPTPRYRLQYDAEEYLAGGRLMTDPEDWSRLLDQQVALPDTYRRPRAIHLITELPREPMVEDAFALRREGAVLSLEPLPVSPSGLDWERMLALIAQVDLVTPDWPTASGIAGDDDPTKVVAHWASLGPSALAVRHGAHGSYVWSRERDEAWHIPPVPAEVIDPTGAGNAYGGGLCVGWTETQDIRRAGCYGAISASMLVRQLGLPEMSPAAQHEARELLPRAIAAARRM